MATTRHRRSAAAVPALRRPLLGALVLGAFLVGPETLGAPVAEAPAAAAGAAVRADGGRYREELLRLAADRIDGVFSEVAASTRAVGEEVAAEAERPAEVSDADVAAWRERSRSQGAAVGFRTWPADRPEPASQAGVPSLYRYDQRALTSDAVARLELLERLVPVVRAAYRSFDFSWVYVTTADEAMLIYPFVPLAEAVNNDRPTDQVFYRAADFARRQVGWTDPYLDLVGAGMMITASYPIYSGGSDGERGELLGVASRDITLDELTASVLGRLAEDADSVAFLVDGRGLAIDASDPDLDRELAAVNGAKRAASVYYRTVDLSTVGDGKAVASRITWVDRVTERLLAVAAGTAAGQPIAFEQDGRDVQAVRLTTTGWLLVVVSAPPGGPGAPTPGTRVEEREAAAPGLWAVYDRSLAGARYIDLTVMVRSDWSKEWPDPSLATREVFPGVSLAAVQFLHQQRHILFHGHEPLDTDDTPTLESEHWLMHHGYTQAEGVTHLDQVPETGCLVTIGYPKLQGGLGGYARYVAICPADWRYGVKIGEVPEAPLARQEKILQWDPERGVRVRR